MKKYYVEVERPTEVLLNNNKCTSCDTKFEDSEEVYIKFEDGPELICGDCYEELDEKTQKYDFEEVTFSEEEICFLGHSNKFRKWYDEIIDPIAKCEDLKHACFTCWGGSGHEDMRKTIHQIYYTHACGDTLKVLPGIGLYSYSNVDIMYRIYKEVLGIDISNLNKCRGSYGGKK